MSLPADVPVHERQGWQTLQSNLQVRKVAEGLYMLRQGQDEHIAITELQLGLLLKKTTN